MSVNLNTQSSVKGIVSTAAAAGVVAGIAAGPAVGIVVGLAAATVGGVSVGLGSKVVSSVMHAPQAIGRAYTNVLGSRAAKAKLAVTVAQEKVAEAEKRSQALNAAADKAKKQLEAARTTLTAAKEQVKKGDQSSCGCYERILNMVQGTPEERAAARLQTAQEAQALAQHNLKSVQEAVKSLKLSQEGAARILQKPLEALVKADTEVQQAKDALKALDARAKAPASAPKSSVATAAGASAIAASAPKSSVAAAAGASAIAAPATIVEGKEAHPAKA